MELLSQIVRGMVSERLRRALLMLQVFIARRGGVVRKGRRLRLGATWLDEDQDVVDAVQRITGVGVATYVGDEMARVAAGGAVGYLELLSPLSDEVIDRVLHTGEEMQVVYEDGGRIWVVRFAPLPDEAGQHVGLLATFADEGGFVDEFEEFRTPLEASLSLRREEDARRRETARTVLATLSRMMTRLRIVALNASIISASFSDRAGLDVVATEMSGLTQEVRALLAKVESVLLGVETEVRAHAGAAALVAAKEAPADAGAGG